jgi:hypothetical protein
VTEPYNPLDMTNLAQNILTALNSNPPVPLGAVDLFSGAGIYALYYTGPIPIYADIARQNADDLFEQPIYVGKAVPAGGRKGVNVATSAATRALWSRIREHSASIGAAENLNLDDFWVRWLVVEPIWIPLGESVMIARHQPLWNSLVDGFGNHDPGNGRIAGVRSMWDTLHPGRAFAEKFPRNPRTISVIEQEVTEHLRARLQV